MMYRKAYEWGKARLEMAGVCDAHVDARELLEFVCNTTRNDLYAHSEMEVTDEQLTQYENFIKRRAEHVPLQHLTGFQEFMGIRFKVTPAVLVPRLDTEILAEEALIAVSDGDRILDMCTGSGCILLSVMKYKNNIEGVGSDISSEALLVAKENYEKLQSEINGRAVFVQGDLFENVDGKFEVILSNPPYIESAVINELSPEVKEHDPMLALDGGEDGLDFYRKIVTESTKYLKSEGKLIFEIGFNQAEAVRNILYDNGFSDIRIIKDLNGLDRVVYARLA